MPDPKPSRRKARTPAEKSLVDFDRPPVNEVVCGIGFLRLQNLSMPYIGLWWSENRAQFPKIRTKEPIMAFAEKDEFPIVGRTMFETEDEGQIIQIQPTRFYYNWVKSRRTNIYPRYSKVYRAFTNHWSKFCDFVSRNNIGDIQPVEYALTYVNYIPQGEPWQKLSDISKVLPDISWRKTRKRRYLAEPFDLNFRYVFALRDQPGRLVATIQRGVRKSDELPILRVELAASGTTEDGLEKHSPETMSHWFDGAREAIVLGFLDLTGDTVQIKTWGRKD